MRDCSSRGRHHSGLAHIRVPCVARGAAMAPAPATSVVDSRSWAPCLSFAPLLHPPRAEPAVGRARDEQRARSAPGWPTPGADPGGPER